MHEKEFVFLSSPTFLSYCILYIDKNHIPTEHKEYPYPCQDTRDILIHVNKQGISFSISRYMDFLRHFHIPLNCPIITIMLVCFKMNLDFISVLIIGGLLIKECLFFFLNYLHLFDWRNSNTHESN